MSLRLSPLLSGKCLGEIYEVHVNNAQLNSIQIEHIFF